MNDNAYIGTANKAKLTVDPTGYADIIQVVQGLFAKSLEALERAGPPPATNRPYSGSVLVRKVSERALGNIQEDRSTRRHSTRGMNAREPDIL